MAKKLKRKPQVKLEPWRYGIKLTSHKDNPDHRCPDCREKRKQ